MKYFKNLKWWHYALAGIAVVGIIYAWRKTRKRKGVSIDTIESEITVTSKPKLKAV